MELKEELIFNEPTIPSRSEGLIADGTPDSSGMNLTDPFYPEKQHHREQNGN